MPKSTLASKAPNFPFRIQVRRSYKNTSTYWLAGLVQGHTVFAIWLGKDLAAIVRLILGGELTEYTEMMGKARAAATNRMVAQAAEMEADAIINIRYMTTSVVGTAAELFAYGTAVKLSE